MYNVDEKIVEIKKYLKKLLMIINNEAVFSLIKTKFVNKNRVDDVLCCIEGSFPEEYKRYLKMGRRLKSNNYYLQLLHVVRNKFWLNSSLYSIHYKEAGYYIAAILSSLDHDIKTCYDNRVNM